MDHSTLYLNVPLQNGILLQQDKQKTLLFQTFHLALLDVSSVVITAEKQGQLKLPPVPWSYMGEKKRTEQFLNSSPLPRFSRVLYESGSD